ncbi:hypothetical protein [Bremerella cremea]|nr:hypothetical protein [Bremerella cremea]
MPKTLRPNLIATLTLATTVSVSGCIFPFSRGSQANIDHTVAELAEPETSPQEASSLAGLPALAPAQSADQPVDMAQVPPAKKKLPPFARFLGNMFGGGSKHPPEASPEPEVSPQTATLTPVETVEITPAKSLINSDPLLPAPPSSPTPESELPPVVRQTDELPPVERQIQASRTPASARVTSESNLPVVVTQETTPKAEMPKVVSRSTDQETQIVAAPQPTEQPESPQPNSPPEVVVEPTPQGSNLDAMAQSPLNKSALLNKAKDNSSSESTTLIHALDLALESVGQEATPPAVTNSAIASQVPQSEPETSTTSEASPQHQPGSAFTQNATSPQSTGLSATQNNPLRSGKTDWSGRGSFGSSQQPQTIVNNKLTEPSEATSRSKKWSASLEPEMPVETVRKGAQVVAAPQPPPATTVNPYALNSDQDIPPMPKSPQRITNQMAGPVRKSAPATRKAANNQAITTTNPLHFESSVVSKMQAASELTNWDFEPEEAASEALPEIIEGKDETPAVPPASAQMPAAQQMPKTTINMTIAPEPQQSTFESTPVESTPIEPAQVEPSPVAQPPIPQAPIRHQPFSKPVLETAPRAIQPSNPAINPAAPWRPRFVPQPNVPSAPAEPNPALQTPNLEAQTEPQPVAEAAPITAQPEARPVIQAVPARPQTFRPQAVTSPTQSAQPAETPSATQRGVMIRPAEPAPLTKENNGNAWRPSPVPANRAPAKLAPVVRPQDTQQNPAFQATPKAYIID